MTGNGERMLRLPGSPGLRRLQVKITKAGLIRALQTKGRNMGLLLLSRKSNEV